MGLMWASGDSRDHMLETLRDTCEQNDGMQGYGWSIYDTRVGGSQTMYDTILHINLTTDFIKSSDGDSWAVRVTGTPRSDHDLPLSVKTTIIFHAAIEQAGSDGTRSLLCGKPGGVEAACNGTVPALGSFGFQVVGDAQNNATHDVAVKTMQVPEEKIWQAKSVFTDQARALAGGSSVLNDEPGAGNMHFIQATFEGSFAITFTYRASEAAFIKPEGLEAGLHKFSSGYPTSVDKAFPRTAPFDQENHALFSQAILSSLLGGLGFFHGDSKADLSHAPEYQETDLEFWKKAATAMSHAPITTTSPKSLLTYTPSRPFFPRGFLWDEGFHLLPVIEWDLDLAVSVLQSWLNLTDDDGWIGREQILGPEARSRVPGEFQTQYPHHANPPTLSLLFPILISKLTGTSQYVGHPSVYLSSPDQASTMLRDLYPLLARQYQWFHRTQAGTFNNTYPRPEGTIPGEGYCWRGRTPLHTLTSGLDDYPRANPPHPGELHIDALAWVGPSAQALHQVAAYLNETADAAMYTEHLSSIKHNLGVLHWDPDSQTYCDTTIDNNNTFKRVCHQGYLSLFPLLLGLLDANHTNLPSVLSLLSDPAKLWSPHGLRSLSAADENYGKDEDYWRGAVWMNLDVLAMQRLRDVGLQKPIPGWSATPVQKTALRLAAELRERVVQTVYDGWAQTGFFWEQYGDASGEGRHSRAFTGWTACVILLMGLRFDEDTAAGTVDGEATSGAALLRTPAWVGGVVVIPVVAVVLLGFGLRSRIWSLVSCVVQSRHTWRLQRVGGGRYEQVADLDEGE
ncbi:glycoside hydrolase family 63 protein [Podospora appendiculata]|uniref:Mannosyl-oligosaccharide glucosidase n=1 Tax=Podospora appendiculata TaxID=314037 RepID=A0AAE0XJH1_9PEZI|nr:glycoside hydrolase family 63 protein [Podospora appendiculata]